MVRLEKAYSVGVGVRDILPPPVLAGTAPTSSNTKFPLGQVWLDTSNGQSYILNRVSSGAATWNQISPASGNSVETITGDSGGALSPVSGNITVAGGTGVTSSGSGSTITVNVDSPVDETIGGTGQTSYTAGDILYADGANSLGKLPVGGVPGSSLIVAFDGELKWFDPSIHVILYEDFFGGFNYGSYSWKGNNNSGVTRSNQIALSTNPGFFSVQTSNSSSSTPSLSLLEFNGWGGQIFGAGRSRFHYYARVRTLSDASETYTARIGFGDQQSAVPSNGVWLEYTHGTNSGNWVGISSNSSTQSTANGTIAATTDWTKLGIEVNADATSVSYFVDDVEISNSPITTNIPASACAPFISMTKSNGTTTRELDVDQFFFFQELTNSRS